jgi:hypothetical protein
VELERHGLPEEEHVVRVPGEHGDRMLYEKIDKNVAQPISCYILMDIFSV